MSTSINNRNFLELYTQNGFNPFLKVIKPKKAEESEVVKLLNLNSSQESRKEIKEALKNVIKLNVVNNEKQFDMSNVQMGVANSDAAQTSEKSTMKSGLGLGAREVITKLLNDLISKGLNKVANWICTKLGGLTKVTPATIIQTLIGVDFEEDGYAMKQGAVSGKGGDFKQGFKNLIDKIKKSFDSATGFFSGFKAGFLETINFLPNLGSMAITNAMKYVGKFLSKIPKVGKDIAAFLGSTLGFGGKLLNTVGDTVGALLTGVKGIGKAIKCIFTGKFDQLKGVFKEAGEKFKKIGLSIRDKAVEWWNDLKKVGKTIGSGIKTVAQKVGAGIKKAAQKVGEGLKKAGEGIKNAAKKVGEGIKKVGKKIGGFFKKLFGKK